MNSLIIDETQAVEFDNEELFSPEELAEVTRSPIPHHVAIIMDGNRRWAKRRHLPCTVGHGKGADTTTRIVQAAAKLGIKVLTVYSFSTENWGRSAEEVEALMHLFKMYLCQQKDFMIQEGVRLETIGDLRRFPSDVRAVLDDCREATKHGEKIDFVLALNYGGRDDIRRAVLAMIEDCENGKLAKETITEKTVSNYLDTAKWPDPQLLIRTSGEKRLSNFLMWQLSYAELYVTDILWPDFTEKDLLEAVRVYQRRERRLGG